jgi:hypothetical protein
MLAGGIGIGKKKDSEKDIPERRYHSTTWW